MVLRMPSKRVTVDSFPEHLPQGTSSLVPVHPPLRRRLTNLLQTIASESFRGISKQYRSSNLESKSSGQSLHQPIPL